MINEAIRSTDVWSRSWNLIPAATKWTINGQSRKGRRGCAKEWNQQWDSINKSPLTELVFGLCSKQTARLVGHVQHRPVSETRVARVEADWYFIDGEGRVAATSGRVKESLSSEPATLVGPSVLHRTRPRIERRACWEKGARLSPGASYVGHSDICANADSAVTYVIWRQIDSHLKYPVERKIFGVITPVSVVVCLRFAT